MLISLTFSYNLESIAKSVRPFKNADFLLYYPIHLVFGKLTPKTIYHNVTSEASP